MSALLADVGLNILEAHVFSTTDGYSLNVFVVDGWPTEVQYFSSFMSYDHIEIVQLERRPVLRVSFGHCEFHGAAANFTTCKHVAEMS